LLDDLYRAQKDADDAEDARNLGIAVLAGVWAFNVIDAVVFFPDFGIVVAGDRLTLRPKATAAGVRVVGEWSF
jgi:hypothetical protein